MVDLGHSADRGAAALKRSIDDIEHFHLRVAESNLKPGLKDETKLL